MPIDSDDLMKYMAGDVLPPATERRVSDELVRRPELRAFGELMGDSIDDESFALDIDPHALALAENMVDELWDSRVARLTMSEPRWPTAGSMVKATVDWGPDLGESSLKLSHNGERVVIRGEWPAGVRPLSLLLCDYNFLGEPGSKATEKRESEGRTKHRLTSEKFPRPATDALEGTGASKVSLVLGLRGSPAFSNGKRPTLNGCDLEVPWFPERDEHTHAEVIVAVNLTNETRHPFRVERMPNKAYLEGKVTGFLSEDNLDGHVDVQTRPLAREDWPLLSPELASLALSQAVPIPRTLEPIKGGYALAPLDSGPPDEASQPETAWLIRYVVQKGGE